MQVLFWVTASRVPPGFLRGWSAGQGFAGIGGDAGDVLRWWFLLEAPNVTEHLKYCVAARVFCIWIGNTNGSRTVESTNVHAYVRDGVALLIVNLRVSMFRVLLSAHAFV